MKKRAFYIMSFAICYLAMACTGNGDHKSSMVSDGSIYIEDSILSFGHISKQNEKTITCVFRLKNIGTRPIIITDTYVSCSCMTAKKPIKPIRPGETIAMPITIATQNLLGAFDKSVVIYSNAKTANNIVRIRGEINY